MVIGLTGTREQLFFKCFLPTPPGSYPTVSTASPLPTERSLCASSQGRRPQPRSWRHSARSGRASSRQLSRCSRRPGLSWPCNGGSWAHLDRSEPEEDRLWGQAAHLSSFTPWPTEPTGGLPLAPSMALPSWLSRLGEWAPWHWTCEAPLWGACEPRGLGVWDACWGAQGF